MEQQTAQPTTILVKSKAYEAYKVQDASMTASYTSKTFHAMRVKGNY